MVRQITSTETKNLTYAIASKLNIPLCVRIAGDGHCKEVEVVWSCITIKLYV